MRISELSEEGQVWPWLYKHAILCLLGDRVLATDTVMCMWQSSSRYIFLGNWWPGAVIYVPGPTASISPHSLSTGTQTLCIHLTWTSELWVLHSCVVRKSCPEPLKREHTEEQRSQTQWFAACFLDFVKREGPAAAKEEKARLLTGRDTWSRACVCYWCLASYGEQKPGNFSNSTNKACTYESPKISMDVNDAWRVRKPWDCPLYFLDFTLSAFISLCQFTCSLWGLWLVWSRLQILNTRTDPLCCLLISQARILEWVVIPISRGSFRPRDWTRIFSVFCIGRQVLHHCATWHPERGWSL